MVAAKNFAEKNKNVCLSVRGMKKEEKMNGEICCLFTTRQAYVVKINNNLVPFVYTHANINVSKIVLC